MSALISTAFLQAEDSFIKQYELDLNGDPVVVSNINFNGPGDGGESSGQKISEKHLINKNSPYYELWTEGMAGDKGWHQLDTASTGPTTYITLVSGDFHDAGEAGGASYRAFTPIRTRADQPYGIVLQSHLTPNPTLEEGEEVTLAHIDMENIYYRSTTLTYDEETNSAGNNTEIFVESSATHKIFNISDITNSSNSEYELFRDVGVLDLLPLEQEINFKQRGQDIYRAYALTMAGNVFVPLTQEKMQIWPIAQGSIVLEGYKPYDTITRSLPDIKITLQDLYPYSTTYALIYKGTKEVPLLDGFPARVIEISRRSIPMDNLVPQSQEFTISADDWKSYVPDDCEYTIEIITHTPFEGLDYPATDPEVAVTLADNGDDQILPFVEGRTSALILDSDNLPTSGGLSLFYTSFTVDRTISVKGNVITSE